jgi:hypothetical protein
VCGSRGYRPRRAVLLGSISARSERPASPHATPNSRQPGDQRGLESERRDSARCRCSSATRCSPVCAR